jgi:membrane fusion protein, copper/silver efflux system
MKRIVPFLLIAVFAGAIGWFLARQSHGGKSPVTSEKKSGRKVLFYQSAMHPWIKSDKPGRCTICGMELTAVYEGDHGFETTRDVVSLNQSMIQVMNVQTVEAKKQSLKKTLPVAGMIEDNAIHHRVLSAYIDGRIDRLHANFIGAEVKEGQALATFYSPTLLQAEREYASLVRRSKSSTNAESLSGQSSLLTGAKQRLRQLGFTEAQIQAIPGKDADDTHTEILAPVGGTVVARNVYEGQYVSAGEKLFEIADFSTMWFMFRAYEQDMPWIKIGQAVDVTTPSLPGQVFKGKITFIDPNFDEINRATKVRVELPNPIVEGRRLLLHRLYADGLVHVETPVVLAAPRSAVIEIGSEAVVYVSQGEGAYARTIVKLGRRGDKVVEILSGLSEGDKVVTHGNLLLDGQAEMNRSFAGEPGLDMKTNMVPLTDTQKKAVEAFVKVADSISVALATDDLAGFNKAGPHAMQATETLVETLKERTDLKDLLTHLFDARHLHDAKDLAAARKAFHPFSNAAAGILSVLRKASDSPEFEIFECPMVDRAIPGVPKKGRWVQGVGRDIANPYFGREMLDCGVKVKP